MTTRQAGSRLRQLVAAIIKHKNKLKMDWSFAYKRSISISTEESSKTSATPSIKYWVNILNKSCKPQTQALRPRRNRGLVRGPGVQLAASDVQQLPQLRHGLFQLRASRSRSQTSPEPLVALDSVGWHG